MIKMEKGYLERLKENQDYYGLTKLIQINKENYKKDCVVHPIIKFIDNFKDLYIKMREECKGRKGSWR